MIWLRVTSSPKSRTMQRWQQTSNTLISFWFSSYIFYSSCFRQIVNIPNSMTVLHDLLPVSLDMWVPSRGGRGFWFPLIRTRKELKGIYNFVNPGLISHNEIMDLYKQVHRSSTSLLSPLCMRLLLSNSLVFAIFLLFICSVCKWCRWLSYSTSTPQVPTRTSHWKNKTRF